MGSVFIVTVGEYSDERPLAVFTEHQTAQAYGRRQQRAQGVGDWAPSVTIREVPFDPPGDERGQSAAWALEDDEWTQFS